MNYELSQFLGHFIEENEGLWEATWEARLSTSVREKESILKKWTMHVDTDKYRNILLPVTVI